MARDYQSRRSKPNNEKTEREEIRELKARLRKTEKLNRILLSENKTLRVALEKTISRVRDLTEHRDLEEILKEVQDGKESEKT